MKVTKPTYFDRFRCLAGDCPDSCCKDWQVQVDASSAARYCALPGALGEDLRAALREEDGETYLTVRDGRCPMWRRDGLCQIQAELGEGALCETCRQFPRLTHDYGDFVERGLELSCPEAAKWILEGLCESVTEEVPGGEAPEYDREAMAVLKRTRGRALEILEERDVSKALALLLLYGCQAQGELDGEEARPFDREAAWETAKAMARPGDPAAVLEFFSGLEILTDTWRQRLKAPAPGALDGRTGNLLRYYVNRYWLQAVSDYDLYGRVKFMVISAIVLRLLGGNFRETAQLFSKEIENDAENLDAILDAAYESPVFTDAKLLGMLL